jgi:hypothetical protein
MDQNKPVWLNFLRHFWMAFYSLNHILLPFLLIYQFLGLLAIDLPGIFLYKNVSADGSWWVGIYWTHPVLISFLSILAIAALGYAFLRRHDYRDYRDSDIESQPGF